MQYISHSTEETIAIGEELGRTLVPGDVLILTGDLGAGKTQFVQGVAVGLGASEVPTSPTFNLVLSAVRGKCYLKLSSCHIVIYDYTVIH